MGRRKLSSSFEMVVKTELYQYSGFRMKRRNLTTKWTVSYRRINKKGTMEEAEKRRKAKKTTVRQREISGISAEMLEKKRAARPVQKDKARDAALKELKSRKGAKKAPVKK